MSTHKRVEEREVSLSLSSRKKVVSFARGVKQRSKRLSCFFLSLERERRDCSTRLESFFFTLKRDGMRFFNGKKESGLDCRGRINGILLLFSLSPPDKFNDATDGKSWRERERERNGEKKVIYTRDLLSGSHCRLFNSRR